MSDAKELIALVKALGEIELSPVLHPGANNC
jgi:hypothetical protein